jgi:protein-S-isoprenylcysteine O-methyltransferase Ste14
MVRRLIVQFVLFAAYMGAVLFLPAGTLAYPGAWTLLALMIGGGIIVTAWLAEHDPKLLRERMGSPVQRGQETWDRVFLIGLMLSFTAWMMFSAWDAARHAFVAVPWWVQALGAAGVVTYMVGARLTFRENSFAAPVVKLQEGQTVIDTGPYAIVRHPMYVAALFLFVGTPLLLGSWWGLAGSAVLIAAVAWRAVNEERVLRAELAGYDAYVERVRYRFIPLVW